MSRRIAFELEFESMFTEIVVSDEQAEEFEKLLDQLENAEGKNRLALRQALNALVVEFIDWEDIAANLEVSDVCGVEMEEGDEDGLDEEAATESAEET